MEPITILLLEFLSPFFYLVSFSFFSTILINAGFIAAYILSNKCNVFFTLTVIYCFHLIYVSILYIVSILATFYFMETFIFFFLLFNHQLILLFFSGDIYLSSRQTNAFLSCFSLFHSCLFYFLCLCRPTK